jgi:hypothetical protein
LSAGIISTQTFGIASIKNRETILFVKPFFWAKSETWVDGEPRGETKASGFSYFAKPVQIRPWPFGVYVVSRNGRHAAPVVDTGVEKTTEIIRQIRRRLKVYVCRKQYASEGNGL